MSDEFGDIEIRHHSVVQKSRDFLDTKFIEIPREKITSVTSGNSFPLWRVSLGIIFIVFGLLSIEVIPLFGSWFFISLLIIGVIFIVLAFVFDTEEIEIKSPTGRIYEKGKGARKFHKDNKFFK